MECLPHCMDGDLDELFPKAIAGPELVEVREEEDWLEVRGRLIASGR